MGWKIDKLVPLNILQQKILHSGSGQVLVPHKEKYKAVKELDCICETQSVLLTVEMQHAFSF